MKIATRVGLIADCAKCTLGFCSQVHLPVWALTVCPHMSAFLCLCLQPDPTPPHPAVPDFVQVCISPQILRKGGLSCLPELLCAYRVSDASQQLRNTLKDHHWPRVTRRQLPSSYNPLVESIAAWTRHLSLSQTAKAAQACRRIRRDECSGCLLGTSPDPLHAQAPPGESHSVAAAVESIEHAVGEVLHDIASLPAPLPMTAAALGVVPRTAHTDHSGAAGDAACAAPEQAAGSRAPVECGEEVVASGVGGRRVRSEMSCSADRARRDQPCESSRLRCRLMPGAEHTLYNIQFASLIALWAPVVCHSASAAATAEAQRQEDLALRCRRVVAPRRRPAEP